MDVISAQIYARYSRYFGRRELSDQEIDACKLIETSLRNFPFLFFIDEADLLAKLSSNFDGFLVFSRAGADDQNFVHCFGNALDLHPPVQDNSARDGFHRETPEPNF